LEWGVTSTLPNPQLEDPPCWLSEYLFDIFTATHHIGGFPPSATWGCTMPW